MVQSALTKTLSIYPHPNAQPDGQLKYQNRWQYTTEMDKEWRKIVKTVRVRYISIMNTDETKADPTGGKIPDAFLDAAYWESRDGGSDDWEYRNAVTLRDLTPQAMLLNAKAAQHATKYMPSLTLINWDFNSIELVPTPESMDKKWLGRTLINFITDMGRMIGQYIKIDPSNSTDEFLVTETKDSRQRGIPHKVLFRDRW